MIDANTRLIRRLVLALCLACLGISGCGGADGGDSGPGESYGTAKERLAAKRQELAEGNSGEPVDVSGRLSSVRERVADRQRAQESTGGSETRAGGTPEAPPKGAPPKNPYAHVGNYLRDDDTGKSSKEPIPAHLPRRERLKRACYRDAFDVTNMAVVPHMPKTWQQFCPCMVDAIVAARISVEMEELLIEDFQGNRSTVEESSSEFRRLWPRCKM